MQKLANLTCIAELVGREDSIEKVYNYLQNKPSRVNPRTGKPFTRFGKLQINEKTGMNDSGNFRITRDAILGNWPNDVNEILNKAIAACSVDVKASIWKLKRTEV